MRPAHTTTLALSLALTLLLAGCGRPNADRTAEGPGRIDAEAPIASGHGAVPLPGDPTALADRPPEGLYAAPPTADTLQQLAKAPVSPDGRYRALFSQGEAWVVRVDGAWIWQVRVPAPPQPTTDGQPPAAGQTAPQGQTGQQAQVGQQPGQPQAGQPGGAAGAVTPPVQAPAAAVTAPLQWTPRSTLLFRDSAGAWHEANPDTAIVTPLAAAFVGVTGLIPSPDGQQVLYYRGTQLFTARRDGSQPRLIGENLVGHWDSAGQLVTTVRAGSQPPQ